MVQAQASNEAAAAVEVYRPCIPPYEKQLEALRKGWARKGYGYLMDMGTGKSKVAIDNFCLLHEQKGVDGFLIIAEKSVYLNWTREDVEDPGELKRHLWKEVAESSVTFVWGQGGLVARRARWRALVEPTHIGARIFVVNIEALSAGAAVEACEQFVRRFKCFIVVDESILISNTKSNRTKAALRLAGLRGPTGEKPYRRILSGMPSNGTPSDIFPQFQFIEPGCLGHMTLRTFQSCYSVMRDMRIGPRTIRVEQKSARNVEELRERMNQHSFRVRKDEVLDLPPKIYEPRIEVQLTKEQELAYHDLRATAMAILGDGRTVTTQIVITQIEKLHQVVCGHVRTDDQTVCYLDTLRPKVLVDLLNRTDEQAIIWCGYRAEQSRLVRVLEEHFGEDCCARWFGDVGLPDRESGERDFQSGRRRFMLASQQSGARGRTWTAASLVVYYSNVHSLELRRQSEDRAHRSGQTKSVTYVDLVTPGTVDESIIKNLRQGRSVADAIVGDGPARWI